MKKDLIFAPILVVLGAALFLLRYTGMTAHIIVSVVGVATLIAYSVLTKKDWRIPPAEILMRVFYGIALITGIVMMSLSGVAAVAVAHKVCAALFALLLVALTVHKLAVSKKA